jgi:drug/metabolite transporter (DMT)-like permease
MDCAAVEASSTAIDVNRDTRRRRGCSWTCVGFCFVLLQGAALGTSASAQLILAAQEFVAVGLLPLVTAALFGLHDVKRVDTTCEI